MVRLGLLMVLATVAQSAWWCSPSVADQPAPTLSGLALTGYSLWSYAPPGWHWAPAPGPLSRAATSAPDGRTTVTFSIPQSALPGVSPTRVRFGIASGFIANGPVVWLSPGQELTFGGDASPLNAPVFGQAPLTRARLLLADGVLRADLNFSFCPALETAWDLMGLVDADSEPDTGYHGAEWLLQNVPLGSGLPAGLKVPWFEARPGIVTRGQPTILTAWALNDGPERLAEVGTRLEVGADVHATPAGPTGTFDLRPGEGRRLVWRVAGDRPGPVPLRLTVCAGERVVRRTRWMTVVRRRDPRRECQTRAGDWLLYPPRPTLQQGSALPLQRVKPRPSRELRRNLFGLTAHLPRSVNDEDPFLPAHAVDGDAATCWASRWWRVAAPFEPEWLQVD